jgi:2-methylcitrate dehydratase PrpD
MRGRSGLASFDDAAVANPAIQSLAQRVDLQEDPSFTARYPNEQPVSIRAVMRDGSTFEGHCIVTKGEPTRPHTAAELRGKFFELGEAVWTRPATQALFDGLMQLEKIDDFRAFMDGLAL